MKKSILLLIVFIISASSTFAAPKYYVDGDSGVRFNL